MSNQPPPWPNSPQGPGQHGPTGGSYNGARNPYPMHMQAPSQPAAFPGPSRGKHRRVPSEDHYGTALTSNNHPLILRRKRSRIIAAPPPSPLTPNFPSKATLALQSSKYPNARRWGIPGQPFNIFNALQRHPPVFFHFTKHLDPEVFIDLLALSNEFNWRVRNNMTSVMQDYASYHAPDCAYYFTWKLFPELCIKDPTMRPIPGRPHLARSVPSFRWAQMVRHRGIVIRRILTILSLEGHRTPAGTQLMLTKYWMLLDLKSQDLRQKFLRNKTVWTDADLILFHLLKFKLDMRIGHPIRGKGACRLSVLLLCQKGLDFLDKFLSGETRINRPVLFSRMLRTYQAEDLDITGHPDFGDPVTSGVPPAQWGILTHEGHDPVKPVMKPAVVLVSKEAVRRCLNVCKYYFHFAAYGFVRPGTAENEPWPMILKKRDGGLGMRKIVACPEKGWPSEREMGERLREWGLEDSDG